VISGSAERREPGFEFFSDFVAGLAEGIELFRFAARGFGGVVYRPVEAVFLDDQARPDTRAGVVGLAADDDQIVQKGLAKVKGEVFRFLIGEVDVGFLHDLYRQRVDFRGGFRAGAHDFEPFTGHMAEKTFGHLAAGRVSGTEDQHVLFFCFHDGKRIGRFEKRLL